MGFSEETIREALKAYEGRHWYRKLGSSDNLQIKQMSEFNVYRYQIDFYTEFRTYVEKTEPYKGKPYDIPSPMTNIWDVDVSTLIPGPFIPGKQVFEVGDPCDSHVVCNWCEGNYKIKCHCVTGWSWNQRYSKECHKCNKGIRKCSHCTKGLVVCSLCNGYAMVKTFTELTVKWKVESFVENDATEVPDCGLKLLDKAGDNVIVFLNEVGRLSSVREPPLLVQSAAALMSKTWGNPVALNQKHRLVKLPVTVAEYQFNDKSGYFYCYGNEICQIYFQSYPAKCVIL